MRLVREAFGPVPTPTACACAVPASMTAAPMDNTVVLMSMIPSQGKLSQLILFNV
jgi:hypothetical protein